MQNLINESGLKRMAKDSPNEKKFEYLYWKEAGVNPETGEITTTLKFFQEKYENDLIMHAEKYKNNNVLQKFLKLNKSEEGYDKLKEELRNFDRVYNIEWPVVHLGTANRYLNRKGENQPATGGSHWQKYLHPAFQRRKFFPELWSEEEIKNWGKEYL
jgi:tryptophan 2,3-dioxygenase